jgi:hypothetical protein
MTSLKIDLDKRDLAIEKIKRDLKTLDNELDNTYSRIEDKELKKEYELLIKEEETIKRNQIKKLKGLYNYINKQEKSNNNNNKKSEEEDKKEILIEINKIEKLLRK